MSAHDDELTALLRELAPDEAALEALREEHRQLEKDLLRLADPLPPHDLLRRVMAKVEAEPARRMSRTDVVTGAAISAVAGVAALVALVSNGSAGSLASALVRVVVLARDGSVALGSGLTAVWTTAPLPLVAGVTMVLMASLVLLKRAAPWRAGVKVTS